jgi:cytochrome P450
MRPPTDGPLEGLLDTDDRTALFDRSMDAWVLRRYEDVSAALGDARLAAGDEPSGDAGRTARLAVRDGARVALSSAHLSEWRPALDASARRMATALPTGVSVDLLQAFAEPWSVALAMTSACAPEDEAQRLAALARVIFLDAAHTANGEPSTHARAASIELGMALAATRQDPRATIDVQAFVALSQTLPCTLAAAWHALLIHPDQGAWLRQSGNTAGAVDELLRFAGPSRVVFRRARASLCLGAAQIAAGQRVALMLAEANRDPVRFPDPNRLELTRDASAHLAFGHGSHSCVGASIVRLAVTVATQALISATPATASIDDVQWIDGVAIRAPSSLAVTFTRDAPSR